MYHTSKVIASTGSVLLNGSHTIVMDFIDDVDIDLLLREVKADGFTSKFLSLQFQHMKADQVVPPVDVYLNLENERAPRERNYVGSMGLYGLVEASERRGQNMIFDVGKIFSEVSRQRNWSKKQFRVTLFSNMPEGVSLSIERVVLYYFES